MPGITGTGAVLGALIQSSIDSLSDEEKRDRQKLFKAMGDAIIAHLLATAPNVAVVSVSLVTPGVGVSGPGTGTLI
jgi:hypothetical protein